MPPASPPSRYRRFLAWATARSGWFDSLVLSLLLAGLGGFAVQWREIVKPRIGDQKMNWQDMGMDVLQRTSFDTPFVVRSALPRPLRPLAGPPRPTSEVVILYMDEQSYAQLNQPKDQPLDRKLHVKLLETLAREGARAVMFDVMFDADSPADPEFAAALSANGRVVLGATIDVNSATPLSPQDAQQFLEGGLDYETLVRSNRTLVRASRGWGLLTFRPIDGDYGVRRLYAGKPREGLDPWPTATWKVAQLAGANLPEDDSRFARRWINYYGPSGAIESISYYRTLVDLSGVPAGSFKDRIVLIGGRSQFGSTSFRRLDEFGTPWSRWGRFQMPGVEIHANILLNLLHRDWLERLPLNTEKWFVVLFGLVLGLLRWLPPWRAVAVALLAGIAIFASACLLQWHARLWWNWSVPVFVQMPAAVVLAVASRYYLEERRKRQLRSAFGFYLSPELAEEIAEHHITLAPGGAKVVATMVFTDLEGFTTLSEKLGDSAKLGEVLTDYFTRTTDEILAEKGTVIKFIGDAVFAAWGAPLAQADHAERAVRAAWRLARASVMDIPVPGANGQAAPVRIRTRIGIHTGEALAGNLGSARRFDYTLIGDAVNFASRLEGANKYTGTTTLLSDDTARLLHGKFLLRRLGAFKVKGKVHAVVIHELLGDDPAARPAWLDTFEAALAAWDSGDAPAARRNFEAVRSARAGVDGPSTLYLELLEKHSGQAHWDREVLLTEK